MPAGYRLLLYFIKQYELCISMGICPTQDNIPVCTLFLKIWPLFRVVLGIAKHINKDCLLGFCKQGARGQAWTTLISWDVSKCQAALQHTVPCWCLPGCHVRSPSWWLWCMTIHSKRKRCYLEPKTVQERFCVPCKTHSTDRSTWNPKSPSTWNQK